MGHHYVWTRSWNTGMGDSRLDFGGLRWTEEWTVMPDIPPVTDLRVKARCSIEVVSSVSGQFPVNFHTKWLLWNVHVHFDCAGSHKTGPGIRDQHFSCKFPHKMALVKCPCAFANRALIEILYRDLTRRPFMEILYRDLVKRAETLRSCTETLRTDLLRSCQEASPCAQHSCDPCG